MSIEAMKDALEALEKIDGAMPFPVGRSAITALRTAIDAAAQPAPVPWSQALESVWAEDDTTPPAAPVQEPALWLEAVAGNLVREGINKHRARKLAAHFHGLAQQPAAQRQWVGLTDEEILSDDTMRYYYGMNGGAGPVSQKGKKVVAAIEAKLKEKNT